MRTPRWTGAAQSAGRTVARRDVLRVAGTGALVSLAGCTDIGFIESFRSFQEDVEDRGIMPVGDDGVGE